MLQGSFKGKRMHLEIVAYDEKHAAALAQLEKENFADPWSEKAYLDLRKHGYCHYFVALRDKLPVGFAGMTVSLDEGDIDKVMVSKDERRKGIASLLLERIFEEGEALGVRDYTLEVRKGNLPAIALYEKHGFVCEGIRPNFYSNPKEDALIMWRRQGLEA